MPSFCSRKEESMHNYRILLSYDGTRYSGWQIQPKGDTIQQRLQEALLTLLRHPVTVIGSGRTDGGVHALGQVAHFHSPKEIDCYRMIASLNGLLPKDIRVYNVESTHPTFHAQYSALSKTYHYQIVNAPIMLPNRRLYALHVPELLDRSLLREGARLLIGRHDFTSFANVQTKNRDNVREMYRLDIADDGKELRFELEANGFLYKMVRNIVGTLMEVGHGQRSLEQLALLIEGKDRRLAGRAVPPQGLFLVHVNYVRSPQRWAHGENAQLAADPIEDDAQQKPKPLQPAYP